MVDEVKPKRAYVDNASLVVLAAFALIEVASALGITPGVASVFAYPISIVVSVALLLCSLLGMYGGSIRWNNHHALDVDDGTYSKNRYSKGYRLQ